MNFMIKLTLLTSSPAATFSGLVHWISRKKNQVQEYNPKEVVKEYLI